MFPGIIRERGTQAGDFQHEKDDLVGRWKVYYLLKENLFPIRPDTCSYPLRLEHLRVLSPPMGGPP